VKMWILPALPAHKRESHHTPPSLYATGPLLKQGSEVLRILVTSSPSLASCQACPLLETALPFRL
jgi:hypothetical protein